MKNNLPIHLVPHLLLGLLTLLSAGPAHAAVYEVGVDGTLTELLDEVTVTLADGDAIYISGNAGAAAEVSHGFQVTKSITIFGDGPGVSVVRKKPLTLASRFLTVAASLRLEGLTLDVADQGRGDHVITAAELHHHVDQRLKALRVDVQTPGLVDLRPGDGQFIFTVPGYRPSPLPDPPLHPGANP